MGGGGMESTEDCGVEERAWEEIWRAMAAGGGTVAGRTEGGTEPERGEAEEEGGSRATFEGEGSRGTLDLGGALVPLMRGLGGREGAGSRGDSGSRGDLIRRPRWV